VTRIEEGRRIEKKEIKEKKRKRRI